MIGEREFSTDTNSYGALAMRHYDIDGNNIDAFYDASDDLIFVLDNTINPNKPNVLLVINPVGDKKWDEILSGQYGVDLENVRPKQDNKYQKLDIEYSGLPVYDGLIKAFLDSEDLTEHLNQLNILRDSAVRHSAMLRLTAANEAITKTNATITRTKDAIIRLQERIKTLKAKLAETKKEIGRVDTKQSAAKILKIQSQIEATNEKLKRAKKRLESAQKRLEIATVDAELAGNLLNQAGQETETVKAAPKSRSVAVKHEYPVRAIEPDEVEPEVEPEDEGGDDMDLEDYDDSFDKELKTKEEPETENDSGVKPLFDKDPEILNEDIAFKPIDFDIPNIPSLDEKTEPEFKPEDNSENATSFETENLETQPDEHPLLPEPEEPEYPVPSFESDEQKSVLDTMTPITDDFDKDFDVPEINSEPEYGLPEPKPVEEPVAPAPVTPIENLVRPVSPAIQTAPAPTASNYGVASNAPVSDSGEEMVYSTQTVKSKPSIMYYLLLLILIVLSIFTLWLYQKNMITTTPVLTQSAEPEYVEKAPVSETVLNEVSEPEPVQVAEPEPVVEPEFVEADNVDVEEPVIEEEQPVVEEEPFEPTISGAVPAYVMTSGQTDEEETISDEEIIVNKPVYEPGSKYDDMFVSEQDYQNYEQPAQPQYTEDEVLEKIKDNVVIFYDEEEAAYRGEQGGFYYSE